MKGSAILAFAGLQNLRWNIGPTFEKKIMSKIKDICHRLILQQWLCENLPSIMTVAKGIMK